MDVARAVHESILIRQGAYCGRRFDTAGGYAIWFVEEGQIKVFEVGGRMVGVLDLDNDAQARQAQRLAA